MVPAQHSTGTALAGARSPWQGAGCPGLGAFVTGSRFLMLQVKHSPSSSSSTTPFAEAEHPHLEGPGNYSLCLVR